MPGKHAWLIAASLIGSGLVAGLTVALSQEASQGRKYALLIGVRKYDPNELRDLRFSEADVTELAAVLREDGYRPENIVLMTQSLGAQDDRFLPRADQIRKELRLLLKGLTEADSILVAFAGHGVQFKASDEVWFCPAGAQLTDKQTLVSLTDVYRELEKSRAGVKLLLSDACRNDPRTANARNRSETDLESVTRPQKSRPPGGVAALFSCSEGELAFEHEKLQHGVFFHFLIRGLRGAADADRNGQITLPELEQYLKKEVYDFVRAEYGRQQTPQLLGQTRGLVPLVVVPEKVIANSLGMKMVLIPPGKFLMGSSRSEEDRDDDEEQHEVEITQPFYLGVHEVTVGQFRTFVQESKSASAAEQDGQGGWGYNAATAQFEGPRAGYTWRNVGWEQTEAHPVVNVTWQDAQAFCAWLSRKEGKTYRLPTEAEWEYACRAGSRTRFAGGDVETSLQKMANVADVSLKAVLDPEAYRNRSYQRWNDRQPFTAPVGVFKANGWGLYDMHGNVWEWCADWYGKGYYRNSPARDPQGPTTGQRRVLRGGAWDSRTPSYRSACRGACVPGERAINLGFRIVLQSR